VVLSADRKYKFGNGLRVRALCMLYNGSVAPGSNTCASTTPTTFSASGSTTGRRDRVHRRVDLLLAGQGPREYLVPEADGGYRVVTAEEGQYLTALAVRSALRAEPTADDAGDADPEGPPWPRRPGRDRAS